MTGAKNPPGDQNTVIAESANNGVYHDERSPLLQSASGKGKESHKLLSTRYLFAYMTFFGFMVGFMSRSNVSVAITAMVNSSYSTHIDNSLNSSVEVCPVYSSNGTTVEKREGKFPWDARTQEFILGAFYYGFIILQLPAGFYADKHSKAAMWMYGLSYFLSSVCTLFIPLAAYNGATTMFIVRFLTGFFEGFTYPCLYSMMTRWAPPTDRSTLLAIAFAGMPIGQIVGQPISGLLCDSEFLGGWPSTFYLFGTLGIIWFIAWVLIVYDSPSSHPRISAEEKEYILSSLKSETKRPDSYPWLSIVTSIPVIAVAVGDFATAFTFNVLASNFPIYLREALGFDITETGFISTLPYVGLGIAIMLGGLFADCLLERQYFSPTTIRKIVTSIGFLPSALFLSLTSFAGCDEVLAISFLTLALAFVGVQFSGSSLAQLEFAPRYVGIVSALVNVFALSAGFIVPLIVGIYTENQVNINGWTTVFWIAFGITIFAEIFYMIFGTSKVQPWAIQKTEEEMDTSRPGPEKA